jgi:hypothetical protein
MKLRVSIDKNGLIDPGPSERGSHTSMDLLLCPRYFAIKKHRGRSKTTDPMRLGSLTHLALAHAVCNRFNVPRVLPWKDAMIEFQVKHAWHANMPDLMWIEGVVPEALESLDRHFGDWRPVLVEAAIRSQIQPDQGWGWAKPLPPEGVLHTQRLDLALESLGRVYHLDWKTTYALRARTFDEHILSLQMLSSSWFGEKLWGARFGGTYVARLVKRTARSHAGEVHVEPLPPVPEAVRAFEQSVCWAGLIEQVFDGEPWANWPGTFRAQACLGLYGPKSQCECFSTCSCGEFEL